MQGERWHNSIVSINDILSASCALRMARDPEWVEEAIRLVVNVAVTQKAHDIVREAGELLAFVDSQALLLFLQKDSSSI